MIKLSILIPTLVGREDYLNCLMNNLNPQLTREVEVLTEIDNRELSIGHKRNLLLDKAQGEYIAFVDDDDQVSDDYVENVLTAIDKGPDVVGVHLYHIEDKVLKGLTYHSLKYDSWWQEWDKEVRLMRYYRNPNHLNPVRRELALQVRFPDISHGEDKDYSMRLKPLLKTEEYIPDPIYFYFFRTHKEV